MTEELISELQDERQLKGGLNRQLIVWIKDLFDLDKEEGDHLGALKAWVIMVR